MSGAKFKDFDRTTVLSPMGPPPKGPVAATAAKGGDGRGGLEADVWRASD